MRPAQPVPSADVESDVEVGSGGESSSSRRYNVAAAQTSESQRQADCCWVEGARSNDDPRGGPLQSTGTASSHSIAAGVETEPVTAVANNHESISLPSSRETMVERPTSGASTTNSNSNSNPNSNNMANLERRKQPRQGGACCGVGYGQPVNEFIVQDLEPQQKSFQASSYQFSRSASHNPSQQVATNAQPHDSHHHHHNNNSHNSNTNLPPLLPNQVASNTIASQQQQMQMQAHNRRLTSGGDLSQSQAANDPQNPYPLYAPITFFYLNQTARPRSWCLKIVSNKYPLHSREA